ncbi:glycoside hydrolase family 3 C-terminal domain-containing protein [Fictibacillus sp. 5RED26]|uniref:glycoside hydrolase family 3 protein n=1 Tax=Fictibacillus sp. 5RED26 TaxID=2745876 RepID=UPI0018CCA1B9|nr:glycoside hydrolase family 3 N-terminal domain-containing protein [Fictibacillus sp. 5RED26]MBH0157960.1 glycoside hydrolase family 3 C-terminal domain-containing protein [Fictibacillus sp. 5RED26]
MFAGIGKAEGVSAKHKRNEGLMIAQNMPQLSKHINGDTVDLAALITSKDGTYVEATNHLIWKSLNKRVASVNSEGLVNLNGKNGATIIIVTDGKSFDKIGIHVKNGKAEFIKQKNQKYDVIKKAIKSMTVKEKVGQMLMPDFRNWKGQPVTEMNDEIRELVKKYHLGGVILFRENVVTTEQTVRLVDEYKKANEDYGLLVSIDQEGGIVTRLQSGTDFPGNMALGATRSTVMAESVGHAIGSELHSLGINMNLAPALDVNNNPDNPVIGVRSFGEDPQLVADLGTAYIKGLQDSGMAATAKHFPGHGDTAVDSHLGLPSVPHEKERLLEVELYPFQQAINNNIDAILTAHVTFPKIDPTTVISKKDGTEINLPATLSYEVLTNLVRKEMGFKGVISTDALNMKAIVDHFGPVDTAIRAVNAGTDIVLMPVGLEEVANGLYEAVDNGEITEKRLNQSVERLLTLKANRGIYKQVSETPIVEKIGHAEEVVGNQEHKALENEVARKSITLVKNDNLLPVNKNEVNSVVVIGNTYIENLQQALASHHSSVELIKADKPLNAEQLQKVKDADLVVLGTYTFNVAGRSPSSPQMQMINQVIEAAPDKTTAVGIRNPYDIMAFPEVSAYLTQYSFRDASFRAAAETIFGLNNPSGKLPVTIYEDGLEQILYPFGHGESY